MRKINIIKGSEKYPLIGIDGGGFQFQNNDPINWEWGKANKTFSINIPNIERNNEVLDNIFWTNWNWEREWEAEMIWEQIRIPGVLTIFQWNTRSARGQFVANNLTSLTTLLGTQLNEIDTSDGDHTKTPGNVVSGMKGTLADGNIIYDYVDRGTGDYFGNESNIKKGIAPQNSELPYPNAFYMPRSIGIHESQPAIKLKWLLEKCFSDWNIEWNIGGTDAEDFLDTLYILRAPFREDLYNPMFLDAEKYEEPDDDELEETITFQRTLPAGGSITPMVFTIDAWGLGNTTSMMGEQNLFPVKEYKIDYGGTWRISANWNMNITLFGAEGGKVQTFRIKDTVIKQIIERKLPDSRTWTTYREETLLDETGESDISNSFSWNATDIREEWSGSDDDWGPPAIDTSPIYVLEDTEWRMYYEITTTPETTQTSGTQVLDMTLSWRHNSPERDPLIPFRSWKQFEPLLGEGSGSPVEISKVVPQWTVGDLLRNTLTLFSAEVYINDALKTIKIINRGASVGDPYDITENIITDSLELTPYSGGDLEWGWKPDSNDAIMIRRWRDSSPFPKSLPGNGEGSKLIEVEWSYTEELDRTNPKTTSQRETFLRMWNNRFQPEYSLDFQPRIVQYLGWTDWDLEIISRTTPTDIHFSASVTPLLTLNGSDSLRWDADPGIWTMFHQENAQRIVDGVKITFQLRLNSQWISQIYYTLGKSLAADYWIGVPGFGGIWQIVKLRWKEGSIWTAEAIRSNNNPISEIIDVE